MKEIDFYPDICKKFQNYLISYLPPGTLIYYSFNKTLPQMIEEIETRSGIKSYLSKGYIPKLRLDILFGIKVRDKNDLQFIVLEVKYLEQLTLAEYSQLVGYLQVAKMIEFGILFLVIKPGNDSTLSNDFKEIIRTGNLPMEWLMLFRNQSDMEYNFKTGICYYLPRNGVEWIDVKQVNGISSFEELANLLIVES